jgi:maleate isomerase
MLPKTAIINTGLYKIIFLSALLLSLYCQGQTVENRNSSSSINTNTDRHSHTDDDFKTIIGSLSGKTIRLPNINKAPMPSVAPSGFVLNGKPFSGIKITNSPGLPDSRSYKKKFALLIPFTNTVMEHELWSIIVNNGNEGELNGVGIHTVNVEIPKPHVNNEAELIQFKEQFINGLNKAVVQANFAQPEYLIMGMSLEHILYGLKDMQSVMKDIEVKYPYSWATWQDAADAALKKYKAKRIAIITPFIKEGNNNAIKMFEDLGYEVVASFGFACPSLVDIAHIPDSAKEEVILKYLATPENRIDAIVQCGTNMSMINVSEKLEPKIGIPIIGINATLLWYALRENGFAKPLIKSGRLLREF